MSEKQLKILDKIQECEMNICILEDRMKSKMFPETKKKCQSLLYSNKKKLNRYVALMNKSFEKEVKEHGNN